MEKTCPKCYGKLDDLANFCPACGEGTSDIAKGLKKQQDIKAQLDILAELSTHIRDENSLQLIKAFILKLKEKAK